MGKQMTAEKAGAPIADAKQMVLGTVIWRLVRRLQVRIAKVVDFHGRGAPQGRPLKCLSRMRGNSHVRF